MKKTVIIVAILGALVAAGVFIYSSVTREGTRGLAGISLPQSQELRPLPREIVQPAPPPAVPSKEKIAIGTAQGTVNVRNFYQDAEMAELDILLLAETNDYIVAYDTFTSTFLIQLFGAPLEATRERAEQELLRKLGITQAEACKLAVEVTGYPPISDFGTRGLSFCPVVVELGR